jgi:excisionase family DNA binding protein
MNVEKATLTVDQAAKVLGVGRASAYAAIARGEVPVVRIGRRILVPRRALERLLAGSSAAEGADGR